MVNGTDRLLKDYVNPPIFTNANLKHPEKPGSNLEFLGLLGLFASSHCQICTRQWPMHTGINTPTHISKICPYFLSSASNFPRETESGKEAWIFSQMSLHPFGREFWRMSGGEGTRIPGAAQGPPSSMSKDVLPLHLKSAASLSYLLIQIFEFFIVLDDFLPNSAGNVFPLEFYVMLLWALQLEHSYKLENLFCIYPSLYISLSTFRYDFPSTITHIGRHHSRVIGTHWIHSQASSF